MVGPEGLHVDAVGHDLGVGAGEVLAQEVPGRTADRDRPVQAPQVGPEERPAVVVADVALGEGVEGGHVGGGRHPQHSHGQRRHEGLVEMEDVEILVLEDLADPPGEVEAEADAGHRVVDRHRDHAPDPVEVGVGHILAGTGRQHLDVVAEQPQMMTELADVRGDAARVGPVVRRDQADLHGRLRTGWVGERFGGSRRRCEGRGGARRSAALAA